MTVIIFVLISSFVFDCFKSCQNGQQLQFWRYLAIGLVIFLIAAMILTHPIHPYIYNTYVSGTSATYSYIALEFDASNMWD
jgi:multisubunit Na+/H+ antiporter MnhB subunit